MTTPVQNRTVEALFRWLPVLCCYFAAKVNRMIAPFFGVLLSELFKPPEKRMLSEIIRISDGSVLIDLVVWKTSQFLYALYVKGMIFRNGRGTPISYARPKFGQKNRHTFVKSIRFVCHTFLKSYVLLMPYVFCRTFSYRHTFYSVRFQTGSVRKCTFIAVSTFGTWNKLFLFSTVSSKNRATLYL